MTHRTPDARPVVSYLPLVTAVLGTAIVLGSVVFFYVEDDMRRLVSVTFGLGILVASIWFAANPFLRNTRRFVPLRREVYVFIDLVRLLNRQVTENADSAEIEASKARMHEAVERITEIAGKSD